MRIDIRKIILQRYLLYPLIIGFFTYHVLNFIEVTEMKDIVHQYGMYSMIKNVTGIDLSFEEGKIIYCYVVGFAYGTISQFFKIHKMRIGLFTLVLFLLKYYMCFFMFGTLALFWIPLEISLFLLITLIILVFKNIRKRFKAFSPIVN
ncbi:hypothetical protein MKX83_24085 [Cytobacillus sp. FSL M8-0252]|uniref:hypothetical protein n=1 Tax=Cytobacillus sp. FSL M8-0252 TaxID=2921621 RepID=UPI0030FAF15D